MASTQKYIEHPTAFMINTLLNSQQCGLNLLTSQVAFVMKVLAILNHIPHLSLHVH